MGAVGVEILAFPLTWHIAYRPTTACCYRTSRDNVGLPADADDSITGTDDLDLLIVLTAARP